MKKLFTIIALIAGVHFSGAAQFTIGAGASYVFPGSSFGFQSKALIGISEKIDFSPSIGILLEDGTPVVVDADVHYNLLEIGSGFRFMPFAGLNYVNNNGSDLGINLGGSFRFDVNENTVYIEPKVTLLTFAGVALSAGVLF